MRIGCAVFKAHGLQACESLRHIGRPVRPVPDEHPDGVGLLRADRLPRQQACDLAARVDAAGCGLNVVVQPPVQLALQYGGFTLGQLLRNGLDQSRLRRPVLAVAPVTTTYHLHKLAFFIDQRDGYTIDLGLYPQIVAALEPVLDAAFVGQLVDARVRNGMRQRANCCL